ncbi:MAG: hypothetical protein ABEH88_08545 [Halobacteriales archaeon]
MSKQSREGGRCTLTYSDAEFLEAVRELAPAGAGAEADAVGCSRQNAECRL